MKAHRTDSVSLFFGLAFLLVSVGYLLKVYLNLNLPSMGWFIAGGLIFLGVVGAITALVPSRREAPPAPLEPATQEENEDSDPEQAR